MFGEPKNRRFLGGVPYSPESRGHMVMPLCVVPGFRTARFSSEIKDFGKTGFRNDSNSQQPLMHHHDGQFGVIDDMAGGAAQDEFTDAAMAIGPHNQ